MFEYREPSDAEVILLSNVLHDWGVEICQSLVSHYARHLSVEGNC
ncbi:MAG: hypothetical protein M2R45_01977 [Verrucomicrobia subdivision 3 bacterium]|nr:hypothetical protein [Limisphaerales bacterium]MCS1416156.1 hypothetical protein [Limisphaerales bacterium]